MSYIMSNPEGGNIVGTFTGEDSAGNENVSPMKADSDQLRNRPQVLAYRNTNVIDGDGANGGRRGGGGLRDGGKTNKGDAPQPEVTPHFLSKRDQRVC